VLCYVTLGDGDTGKAIAALQEDFETAKAENEELRMKVGQLQSQLDDLAAYVKGNQVVAEAVEIK
jgi:hypothetical protein